MSTGFNLEQPGGAPKLGPGRVLLEHELSELRLLLERQAGVLLNAPHDVLAANLAQYMEFRRCSSMLDLLGRVQASDAECESLLEHLLDPETAFFRHPAAFEGFEKQILPELRLRKASDNAASLRFWSAGCSSGPAWHSRNRASRR